MGTRATPIVAFGFNIGAEEEVEIDDFAALVEAADNLEDKDWPVKLVAHGHHDYRFFFLSIRGTDTHAGDWGDTITVPLSNGAPSKERLDAARVWCEQHGIEWQAPAWCAMASYG